MEENIEMKLEDLNQAQLDSLFSLGEIDACTYYECSQDLKRKTFFFKLKEKIKKIFNFKG